MQKRIFFEEIRIPEAADADSGILFAAAAAMEKTGKKEGTMDIVPSYNKSVFNAFY